MLHNSTQNYTMLNYATPFYTTLNNAKQHKRARQRHALFVYIALCELLLPVEVERHLQTKIQEAQLIDISIVYRVYAHLTYSTCF